MALIGSAFYGLRTTLVAYILLALLSIPRSENLKEHVPGELGRIIELDRILEVKTLRRKLTVLASRKMGQNFGRELARKRIAERGHMMGFLYIDGHVRAYHGKQRIAKGYDTRKRLAVPATTDYWVNDRSGDPLFVVTAEANALLMRMLGPILQETRMLLGADRRATVVFDRGGWSAFLALGFACTSPSPGTKNHEKADRLPRGYVRSSELTESQRVAVPCIPLISPSLAVEEQLLEHTLLQATDGLLYSDRLASQAHSPLISAPGCTAPFPAQTCVPEWAPAE
jgi:hypothetical protein